MVTGAVAGNYTITATNMGPSTASNVVIKDNLPAGVTFQSASGSYTLSNNVVTWPGVTLAKLAGIAQAQSDTEAALAMQRAKRQLLIRVGKRGA